MENIKKVEKEVLLECFDIYDLEGSLDDLIKSLESLKNDEIYTKYTVSVDTDFYNGDDSYAQFTVYGYRMETDEELNTKIDNWNKMELAKYLKEEKRIADEKALFMELKAKYEK